jgi:hypothetical protein
MPARTEWYGDRIKADMRDRMERNMRQALLYLQGETRRLINRGQPTKRSGRSVVGLAPSRPGEPPKRLTGRLIQSIAIKVKPSKRVIKGTYGSNLVYARRLELGFTGTDARGRNVRQRPRPYLRRALIDNKATVARILRQP